MANFRTFERKQSAIMMNDHNFFKTMERLLSHLLVMVLLMAGRSLTAQDLRYARQMDSTLTSARLGGRGYVDKGNRRAARFLAKQFKNMGLKAFGKSYYQSFPISINTIQEVKTLSIDGRSLKAGRDFLIGSASPSCKGSFELVYLPDSILDKPRALETFFSQDLKNKFILAGERFKKSAYLDELPAKGLVIRQKSKLIWSISEGRKPRNFVVVRIPDSLISPEAGTISLSIRSKYYPQYPTQNLVAYVEGKKYPDSFLVLTAHYDHLGKMGHEVYFPGANDNASGTSMVFDMARYFSRSGRRPDYSIVFMTFSGEEAGLLGSKYYTEHPLFPLQNIRFLINLDMVGTGSQGITVVNARRYPRAFALLQDINRRDSLLARVKARGESCNSDHCPFYQKGVPSFFIYTMGDEYVEYHNIYDRYPDIPFTEYEDLFRLVSTFLTQY